ncbi:MAG: hypothetical protein ACJATI_005102 [Halioglobus sp.]|jgi:hypothetical protein
MNRKYLQEKWIAIRKSRTDNQFKVLRFFDNPKVRLFVAITTVDERAIIIYCDNISSIDRLPVDKENISLVIKEDAVILTLTNSVYQDVFDDLILSIASTLLKEDRSDNHLSLFITKYVEWATFFRNGSSQRLSFEQLLGLYGELTVLKQTLLSGGQFMHNDTISSWRGPFGDVHDFVFEKYDLEVKTKLCKTSTINISSKYQLEPDGERALKLSIVNLMSDDSKGRALHSLILSIRDILDSGNSDLNILHRALLMFDMTLESSVEYDNYRFTLDSINIYNTMLENFPKLVTDNMAVGVSSVRYKLDTKALKPFIIS